MSSLESFFGLEDSEGAGSEEAAEKFREQMRKSAAAAKAIAAHQSNQKKKEDKLARIFIKFLQNKAKSDIIFLIVRLLEQNVPGAFILAILLLSDQELEKDLEVDLKKRSQEIQKENQLLETFESDESVPQSIKAELNAWGEEILKAGLIMPNKTLDAVLTPDQKLKSLVLDLIEYSLLEYFDRHTMSFNEDKIKQFALISIQSVLIKLREEAKKQTDEELIEGKI